MNENPVEDLLAQLPNTIWDGNVDYVRKAIRDAFCAERDAALEEAARDCEIGDTVERAMDPITSFHLKQVEELQEEIKRLRAENEGLRHARATLIRNHQRAEESEKMKPAAIVAAGKAGE